MQVNVETFLGGANYYENVIKDFIIIKVHQIIVLYKYMVFRRVLYGNFILIHGITIIYICTGQ